MIFFCVQLFTPQASKTKSIQSGSKIISQNKKEKSLVCLVLRRHLKVITTVCAWMFSETHPQIHVEKSLFQDCLQMYFLDWCLSTQSAWFLFNIIVLISFPSAIGIILWESCTAEFISWRTKNKFYFYSKARKRKC